MLPSYFLDKKLFAFIIYEIVILNRLYLQYLETNKNEFWNNFKINDIKFLMIKLIICW